MEKIQFKFSDYLAGYKCSHPGDMGGWYYQSADVDAEIKALKASIVELDHKYARALSDLVAQRREGGS